jgi:NADH-quinone oxidoreductase subunit A
MGRSGPREFRFRNKDRRAYRKMINQYIPLLIVFGFSAFLALFFIVASRFLGPRRETPEKQMTYECGIDPIGDARLRFSVKFFIIAIIFLVFDVEVVFLYPWAVLFRKLGVFGFIEMAIFLLVLILGLFYVWKRGALEWE